MTGQDVIVALATLLVGLGTVGGAVYFVAGLAVAKAMGAHREATDGEVDKLRAEIGALRAEVAELRGQARPLLVAVERVIAAAGGGR